MSSVGAVSAALGLTDEAVRNPARRASAPDDLSLVAGFRRPHHRPSERTAPVALRERRASRERPFLVHHVWSLRNLRSFLQVVAPVLPSEPSFPSIAAKYPVANWFEREVMDVFGLTPEGHPNPMRVALHDDWPEGLWALRKDFPGDAVVPRVAGDFHPFRPVTGEGVFQVPWDPCMRGSSSPATFGLASPVSLCCTFSSGSSTCIRNREALRVAVASWSLPRPINLRRHRGWPLARVRARHRTSGGHHGACARTCAPGGVAGTGAPLQPHGRHRCTRDRRGVYRPGESGTGTPRRPRPAAGPAVRHAAAAGDHRVGWSDRDLPPQACDALRTHLHGSRSSSTN